MKSILIERMVQEGYFNKELLERPGTIKELIDKTKLLRENSNFELVGSVGGVCMIYELIDEESQKELEVWYNNHEPSIYFKVPSKNWLPKGVTGNSTFIPIGGGVTFQIASNPEERECSLVHLLRVGGFRRICDRNSIGIFLKEDSGEIAREINLCKYLMQNSSLDLHIAMGVSLSGKVEFELKFI